MQNIQQMINNEPDLDPPELPADTDGPSSDGISVIRVCLMPVINARLHVAYFKINTNTPMGALKTYFHQILQLPEGEFRFKFRGKIITDTDTPTTLAMQNNDEIHVFKNRTAG